MCQCSNCQQHVCVSHTAFIHVQQATAYWIANQKIIPLFINSGSTITINVLWRKIHVGLFREHFSSISSHNCIYRERERKEVRERRNKEEEVFTSAGHGLLPPQWLSLFSSPLSAHHCTSWTWEHGGCSGGGRGRGGEGGVRWSEEDEEEEEEGKKEEEEEEEEEEGEGEEEDGLSGVEMV